MDIRLIAVLLIGLPMVLASATLAAQAWRAQKQAFSKRHWLQTKGRIIHSEVREIRVTVPKPSSTSSYRQATRYAPHIVYEYWIDGMRYEGEKNSKSPVLLGSEANDAGREVNSHPPGMEVTVYYDPNNPVESTLDLWPTMGAWVLLAVTILIIALMIAVIALILKIPPMHL